MAGLFSKVARFASSPQGQAALAKAKAAANDPKNRAKFDDLVDKAKQRAGGFAQSGDTGRADSSTTGTTTTVTPVERDPRPAATRDLDGPAGNHDTANHDTANHDNKRDTPRPADS